MRWDEGFREKIRSKLEESSVPEPNTGCLLWLRKAESDYGYGIINTGAGNIVAHRASFLAFVGEIPDGLFVLHSCDTAACLNPGHLRLGTKQDNTNDAKARNRGVGRPSRLTQEQFEALRGRLLAGESMSELSREYGLAKTYLVQIRAGMVLRNFRKPVLPG